MKKNLVFIIAGLLMVTSTENIFATTPSATARAGGAKGSKAQPVEAKASAQVSGGGRDQAIKSIGEYKNTIGSNEVMDRDPGFSSWKAIVSNVETFIKANAKGDTKITSALQAVAGQGGLNDALIRAINDARAGLRLGQMTTDAETQVKQNFAKIQKQASDIKNTLNKSTFLVQSKKDASAVLAQLATAIGVSALSAAVTFHTKNASLPASKSLKPYVGVAPKQAQGGAAGVAKINLGGKKK